MKKYIITICFLICISWTSYAQTFAEWFKQNKTQKKYLLEQIAALKVYLDYGKKGYRIITDGTSLIGDIKSGDFSLHKQYFNSLKTVNPAIRNSEKVNDIIQMNKAMLNDNNSMMKFIARSLVYSPSEVLSIRRLYTIVGQEISENIDELMLLIKDDNLELSDDERIVRLEKLYYRMKSGYGFQLQASKNIKALAESRNSDLESIEVLKKQFGH